MDSTDRERAWPNLTLLEVDPPPSNIPSLIVRKDDARQESPPLTDGETKAPKRGMGLPSQCLPT